MKLLWAKIKNYKTFNETGEIRFSSGFNIFIGQNDAGKSAFLEALSTRASYIPHRSLASAPDQNSPDDNESVFQLGFALSKAELNEYFNSQSEIWLPASTGSSNFSQPDIVQDLFAATLNSSDELISTWVANTRGKSATPTGGHLVSLAHLNHVQTFLLFRNLAAPRGIKLSVTSTSSANKYHTGLSTWIAQSIYSFRAERLAIASSPTNGREALEPNASNLPEVLNVLQTRHTHLWKKYLEHVRTIFPHITEVKAVFTTSSRVEIWVSTTDPGLSRSDLDFSLADSGTGIGQALAMLYVVVHSTRPQLILIDEPQSFLHPGALRKLLEILRLYGKHQYILTTHSPLSIPLSDTDKMFQIVRTPEGSTVKEITERDDLIAALSDVGARMSDVYGAESVLWVEGPTEERCFPEIIRGIANEPLQGAVIIGVANTGDLESRDATRVCEIYERLTRSSALLPKTLAFMFDTERRSESERDDLTRRLRGLMHWLPLCMYENYLLHPGAIAHVLTELRGSEHAAIVSAQVEDWLTSNGGDQKYFHGMHPIPYGADEWKSRVHGANVLKDLFNNMTAESGLHDYSKVVHGLKLTQYLVKEPSPELRALATQLANLIKEG